MKKILLALVALTFIYSVNISSTHAAFSLSVSGSEVTVNISAGTEASPNLASQLADQMMADTNPTIAAAAFRDGDLMWFDNIRLVSLRNSWFKWDDDAKIELRTDFRSTPENESSSGANDAGGVIFGYRSILHLKTGVFRVDNNCRPIGTGGQLIFLRDSNGINPTIVKEMTARNDYPTFAVASATIPARVVLEGLSYKLLSSTSSQKWYFGNSRNINGDDKFENLELSGTGEIFQTFNTTYVTPKVPTFNIAGDTPDSDVRIINGQFGTDGGASAGFTGTFRGGQYIIDSPEFPINQWNGNINSGFSSGSNLFMVRFKNEIAVSDGISPISGARARWSQSVRTAGSGYDTSALVSFPQNSEINLTTPADGKLETYLIDTLKARNTGGITNINGATETYNYSLQVRQYNHTAPQYAYQDRNYGVGGILGDANETIIMVTDSNISSSQVATNALSEINSLDQLYDRAKSSWVDGNDWESDQYLVGNNDQLSSTPNLNLVFDNTAATAFSIDTVTDTITVKSSTLNCTGQKFTSLVTNGTVSFVNGAAPGTCIFTDNTGTNGVLTLTGIDNANVLIYDDLSATNDTISYLVSQNGTIDIPFAATSSTDYQVVVRRAGYSEANFEFDPSGGGFFEFPISQSQALTIEGTSIYQNTGDLAKLTMDFPNLKINVGDFTIDGQELYDTLQNIELTESGMKYPRIANFDGKSKILLLNNYQIRNRDGATTVPGINAFVFAAGGGILDASNGSVQFLTDSTATVDKQDQIVKMIEGLQGSSWDNTNEVFTIPNANLVDITGTGFDSLTDSLSSLIDSMLDRGILDVNTAKDLMQ